MLPAISKSFCLLLFMSVSSQSGLAQANPPVAKPTPSPAPVAQPFPQSPQLAPQDRPLERPSILLNLFIFSVADTNSHKKPKEIAESVEREYAKGLLNDKSKSDFQVDLRQLLDDPTSGLQVLSRPSMMLVAEKQGVIQIGNEVTMQYMVPAKEGLFELKKTEPFKLGMEISVKVKEPQTEIIDGKEIRTTVLMPLLFSMSTIEGRMDYPGVDLQIGHPKVSTRFLETGLTLKEKVPMLVELPWDRGPNVFLLIWFEVPEPN